MNKLFLSVLCLLTVIAAGCRKSLENAADVNSDFNFYQLNAYLDSPVYLDANVTSSTNYDWDFGDGSAHGNTASVNHSYTKAGVYTITLKIGKLSTSKKVRVYPGEFSYQIRNSLDRDYSNYQIRITDAANSNVYMQNGGLIAKGNVTDTIFVTLSSSRANNGLYVDGNVYSDKGNLLKFGVGGTYGSGHHTVIDITPASIALFYETSGNITLPSTGIPVSTGLSTY